MRLAGRDPLPCKPSPILTNLLTLVINYIKGRSRGKRAYRGNVGEVGRLVGAWPSPNRLKLNNLQQSAESLEAFIKNTLAREASESYLRELRQQEMGIYSVTDDIKKLRDAVLVCQSIYKLITEPYNPPAPISRQEVDPSTATIEL